MFTIPNFFTFLRIALIPFVLIQLSRGNYLAAGWMFGAAAFTDILDGGLARRFGTESKFGQYLDPIADKLLLTTIYIGLARAEFSNVRLAPRSNALVRCKTRITEDQLYSA